MAWTRQDLVRDFRRLGLKPGMTVMVHSALSTIGEVEGGADTVIDALLEVLGPQGTLVMPTMGGAEVWNHETTPSTIAILTERWRQRPESIRSWHPTHSVAAGGKQAEFLVEGHLEAPTPYGEGTPYVKNMDLGGYVLLIGVDQDRNTTLHSLEALVDAPYLRTSSGSTWPPMDG